MSELPWDRLDTNKFTLEQKLDFSFRQRLLTRSIVLVKGFNFASPFLSESIINFFINVPYKWLLGQYLYKRILVECYQDLFKLPVKICAGLPLFAPQEQIFIQKGIARVKPHITRSDPYCSHPRTTYINWIESMRHKGKFQDLVYTTFH